MKIGIYGGTFDPPHIGHINAAISGKKQVGAEKLLLIPAGLPPHKELARCSAGSEDRFEMTRLAAEYIDGAQVSRMEILRGGKSYTVNTLAELKDIYPEDELVLFIGTDMLLTFDQWYRFEDIFKLCTIAVFARNDHDRARIKEKSLYFGREFGAKIEIIDNSAIDISSTELRDRLAVREGAEYLPDEIYEYIISKHLYNAKPTFDWLRIKAYGMLKDNRMRHVAGCEYEAVRLAERWGADADEAREAAILHDITKKLSLDAQLILCDKYDIITDNAERADAKLLHSKTGAEIARDMFGVSESVYSAIYWHTTGRENMTLAEKIMYLADYIEPTRDFDGLSRLRNLAYADIDSAMLLGLEMSLEDLRQRGIVPHEKTQQAIDWLRKEKGIKI